MTRTHRPIAVGRGSLAFLFGLCEVEELPAPFLVEVLGALGMSASGARSFLSRAVADGDLVSHRHGRRAIYALSGTFLSRYRAIKQSFFARPRWAGHFHAVVYDVPETRRTERDALRAAAFAEGWGSPRPGVLLGLNPPGGWEQHEGCFAGRLEVGIDTARGLAARAWPLEEAQDRIHSLAAYLEDVSEARAELDVEQAPRSALLACVVTAHDVLSSTTYLWGTLPALPAELLPAAYPHEELARITAALTGPVMEAGALASARLLATYPQP